MLFRSVGGEFFLVSSGFGLVSISRGDLDSFDDSLSSIHKCDLDSFDNRLSSFHDDFALDILWFFFFERLSLFYWL